MGKRGLYLSSPFFLHSTMEEQDPISIVHNIFNEFFGEENVDLQGQTMLIHFPEVKVTNEHDRSVDITHLWVKVKLSLDGTIDGYFQMMRSELTLEQFESGYSHSHIHGVNSNNYYSWSDPCLGNGPIRNTIVSLSTQFSEEMWNLFCLELSKYVTVESLTGVPYMYLERIGTSNNSTTQEIHFPFSHIDRCPSELEPYIAAFIPAILSKKPFGFNFSNGSYGIAMSDRDLFITLSNLFIEWYNSLPAAQQTSREELFARGIICKGKCIGNKLYYVFDSNTNAAANYNRLIGRSLFRFKNRTITFNITNIVRTVDDDPNMSIFLSETMVMVIIDRILRTINNKYGQPSTEEGTFSGEAHRYL